MTFTDIMLVISIMAPFMILTIVILAVFFVGRK
jgi:hypothetical protein